jgi:PAS domain S-box-containing protein
MKSHESPLHATSLIGAPPHASPVSDDFQQLAELMPQLVWTTRPDGFHDYYNRRWYEYTGTTPEQSQGEGWQGPFHPEDMPETLRRWHHSLRTGEPYETEYRCRRHDGVYRWFLGRAHPLRDASGRIVKWFGTCTDIDDQKRAADSMRFLAEAGALLASSSLDYEATLAALTRLAVPRLADWCAIEIANEDGTTRQVGVAHVDPAKVRLAHELRLRYPPDPKLPHGVAHVIRTGQPVFLPDIPDALLVASARDEEHLRIARELGLRSAMTLPLTARGRTLGALTLVNAESRRRFTREDLTLAEELAARAALAVDNARLYREAVHAEERFRSLITATAQAVWVTRPDGIVVEDSPSWRAFTGQTYEQWRDRGWLDAIHPEDRELAARAWAGAVASRRLYEVEYRLRRPDGRYSITLARAVPVLDPDGRVREWVGVNIDFTAQREAEASARHLQAEQSARRHAALRADVSAALTAPGTKEQALQAACEAVVRHLGVTLARVWTLDRAHPALLLRASAGRTLPAGEHASVPLGQLLVGRIAQERRPRVNLQGGQQGWEEDAGWAARERLESFAGYPLLLGGQLVGVFTVFHTGPLERELPDVLAAVAEIITQGVERRRAEEALRQHALELARSNEELQQFAYVASHDLQEPLRMVASYTQLLARRYRGRLDADADEFIGYAVDGVNRMQRLIQDLLAYSRVGTRGREPRPCDAGQALQRAADNLRTMFQETQGELKAGPLPRVLADETQLIQLFQNLVGNGLKFHGTAPPRVEVAAEPHGPGWWRFTVKDNGLGIDPQYFERIFIIFQRLHGREEFPGTGIGLAICKKIVERHGGRIGLESRPGEGSTFWFTLPAASDEAPLPPGSPA